MALRFIVLFIVVVLYFFSPYDYDFYPKCPFKWLTGKDCFVCGSTRAAYHLLHFEFAAAWQKNPYLLLILALFTLNFFFKMFSKKIFPLVIFFLSAIF
jgi:Protein of unknown function (DUF2752)